MLVLVILMNIRPARSARARVIASGPPDGGWGEGDGDCGGDGSQDFQIPLRCCCASCAAASSRARLLSSPVSPAWARPLPQHGGVDEPAATEDIARTVRAHRRPAAAARARRRAAGARARAAPRCSRTPPAQARSRRRGRSCAACHRRGPSRCRRRPRGRPSRPLAGATGTKRATAPTAAMRRTECSRVLMCASLLGDAPAAIATPGVSPLPLERAASWFSCEPRALGEQLQLPQQRSGPIRAATAWASRNATLGSPPAATRASACRQRQ